ncbi:Myxococcus cysteine-rich repeat-containing protein [Balamuthia mandrillaris]
MISAMLLLALLLAGWSTQAKAQDPDQLYHPAGGEMRLDGPNGGYGTILARNDHNGFLALYYGLQSGAFQLFAQQYGAQVEELGSAVRVNQRDDMSTAPMSTDATMGHVRGVGGMAGLQMSNGKWLILFTYYQAWSGAPHQAPIIMGAILNEDLTLSKSEMVMPGQQGKCEVEAVGKENIAGTYRIAYRCHTTDPMDPARVIPVVHQCKFDATFTQCIGGSWYDQDWMGRRGNYSFSTELVGGHLIAFYEHLDKEDNEQKVHWVAHTFSDQFIRARESANQGQRDPGLLPISSTKAFILWNQGGYTNEWYREAWYRGLELNSHGLAWIGGRVQADSDKDGHENCYEPMGLHVPHGANPRVLLFWIGVRENDLRKNPWRVTGRVYHINYDTFTLQPTSSIHFKQLAQFTPSEIRGLKAILLQDGNFFVSWNGAGVYSSPPGYHLTGRLYTPVDLGACGNGILESGEECDNGAANSNSQANACREDCTNARCGDGVVDSGEQCDLGTENNSDTPEGTCRTTCKLPYCGDGVVNGDEQCDTGVALSDSKANACRTSCTNPTCGDGIKDDSEQCDNGVLNAWSPNMCRPGTCVLPTCGDGVKDSFEECDNGPDNSGTKDACRTDCTSPTCGDGIVDTGEQCDAGENNDNSLPDACRENCQAARCGDGVKDNGEQCDTGSNRSLLPDSCRPDCRQPTCGDGVKDSGEQCDTAATANLPNQCRTNCQLPTCGDGIKDTGEQCDTGPNRSNTVANACRLTCHLPSCGDGVQDNDEQCDQGAANANTAQAACRTDCTLPRCGDGVINGDEECDTGNDRSNTRANACRMDCTNPRCGDEVQDNGEQCDEGAQNGVGECSTACMLAACGDGQVNSGEQCDDGAHNSDDLPNACRTTCLLPSCGDGVVDAGEDCDNGATNSDSNSDACRTDCKLPSCGDGVIDNGRGEECDKGDANSDEEANACRTDCKLPSCGDGVVDNGNDEECDTGELLSDMVANACRSNCKEAFCGDGVRDNGEQCDRGTILNSNSEPDACRTDCTLPRCGDGVIDAEEECDDGGANSNTKPDACRTTCKKASCGDSVKDSGEQCDNGPANGKLADTCRLTCKLPYCGDDIKDSGEECDNGNKRSNTKPNTCRLNCLLPFCGDGVVDGSTKYGEECDTGTARSDVEPDACRTACQAPKCGDGVVDSSEECDNGAENNRNDLPNACRAECSLPRCGDGVVDDQYGETCDDGVNNSNTTGNACRSDCRIPICGDGVVDDADEYYNEECDPGAALLSNVEPDACRTNCKNATCGDGVTDRREQCDEGVLNSNTEENRCRTDCRLPRCGDGVVDDEHNENCDDGLPAGICVQSNCRCPLCAPGESLRIVAGLCGCYCPPGYAREITSSGSRCRLMPVEPSTPDSSSSSSSSSNGGGQTTPMVSTCALGGGWLCPGGLCFSSSACECNANINGCPQDRPCRCQTGACRATTQECFCAMVGDSGIGTLCLTGVCTTSPQQCPSAPHTIRTVDTDVVVEDASPASPSDLSVDIRDEEHNYSNTMLSVNNITSPSVLQIRDVPPNEEPIAQDNNIPLVPSIFISIVPLDNNHPNNQPSANMTWTLPTRMFPNINESTPLYINQTFSNGSSTIRPVTFTLVFDSIRITAKDLSIPPGEGPSRITLLVGRPFAASEDGQQDSSNNNLAIVGAAVGGGVFLLTLLVSAAGLGYMHARRRRIQNRLTTRLSANFGLANTSREYNF